MASSTDPTTIYVRLLNEGIDVWRPVLAHRLGETTYRIDDDPVPHDEAWSFQPGDIVVVEYRRSDTDDADHLTAVARATQFDEPSWSHRRLAG